MVRSAGAGPQRLAAARGGTGSRPTARRRVAFECGFFVAVAWLEPRRQSTASGGGSGPPAARDFVVRRPDAHRCSGAASHRSRRVRGRKLVAGGCARCECSATRRGGARGTWSTSATWCGRTRAASESRREKEAYTGRDAGTPTSSTAPRTRRTPAASQAASGSGPSNDVARMRGYDGDQLSPRAL